MRTSNSCEWEFFYPNPCPHPSRGASDGFRRIQRRGGTFSSVGLLNVVHDGQERDDPVREGDLLGGHGQVPARQHVEVRVGVAGDEALLRHCERLVGGAVQHLHPPTVPETDAATLDGPGELAAEGRRQPRVEDHAGQGVVREVRRRQQALADVPGGLALAEVEEAVAMVDAEPRLGPPVLLQLEQLRGPAVGVAALEVVLEDRLEARQEGGVPRLEPDAAGTVGKAEAHDEEQINVVEVPDILAILVVHIHELAELEEVLPLDERDLRGDDLAAVGHLHTLQRRGAAIVIPGDAEHKARGEQHEGGGDARYRSAARAKATALPGGGSVAGAPARAG
mmetsp:Transcript_21157/g.60468  ORF Transcript_21157/g.60468 Transcript_21157/m.60468 type:complete len:337 (+) Transcript_21157:1-1011(+)